MRCGPGVPRFPSQSVWAGVFLSAGAWALALSAAPSALAREGPLSARAQIVAEDRATLASRLDGQLTSVRATLGEKVRKGQLLMTFDCRSLRAVARRVRANLRAADATWRTKQRLVQLRAAGKLDMDLAAAERDKAAASVEEVAARLRHCRILAPFDGRVAKLHVKAFESVTPGKPLVDLVGRRLKIRLLVPGRWLRWLRRGQAFELRIEETGRTYGAKVQTIGARVDTSSQRIELLGTLEGVTEKLLPGMSGAAVFEKPAAGQ